MGAPQRLGAGAPGLATKWSGCSKVWRLLGTHPYKVTPCRGGSTDFRQTTISGRNGGTTLLTWAIIFLVVALIAAFFGFGGVSTAAAGIAKVLFFIFLIIFVIMLIMSFMGGAAA